jgi:hypothetical protein
MWHSFLYHYSSYVWDLVPSQLVIISRPGFGPLKPGCDSPYAGKRRRPRGPEAVALPRPASKWRPSTWAVSRKAWGARNDDHACHPPIRRSSGGPSDDLHLCLFRRRRPPATTSSDSCFLFDYCVLCLPHLLFTVKTIWFYAWTQSLYISLLHTYVLHAHWKDNSLIYVVLIYHKHQIIYVRKSQICTSAIKLSLIPACS